MDPTLVLGAGLSGLSAARHLVTRGVDVKLVDKGRGVGGRMATRRIGDAVVDHGAQFFTTRGTAFKALVADAVAEGVAAEWCRGFNVEDGYPRYYGAGGMSSLPKWLARDLDITLGVEVAAVKADEAGIEFVDADGATVAAGSSAIVTAPIPQMLGLFDSGNVQLDQTLARQLRSTDYFATFALLVVLDGEPAIGEPGGIQMDDGPFTFIGDNQRKGISPVRAVTFHAEHDYSLERLDDDRSDVTADLLRLAEPWLGDATPVEVQLMRWRYAGPETPLPYATAVVETPGGPIALAGDAFAGPKVEGAFNSGLAAAAAILPVVTTQP